MALTVTTKSNFVIGDRRAVIADIDFDSSYPTGGEDLTPETLGFTSRADFVLAEPAGGYLFEYDHTGKKLIARRGDNPNAAAAPAVEVTAATNLSTVTGVRIFAIGV